MLTEEPTTIELPAVGDWLMTLPEATVLLEAVVTAPTTKPAALMAVAAAACVKPTTLGTETVGGPVETTMLTEEPGLTEAPAAGDSLMTKPAATVLLEDALIVPTVKPAPVIEAVAAD
jgi:hypothetical protein